MANAIICNLTNDLYRATKHAMTKTSARQHDYLLISYCVSTRRRFDMIGFVKTPKTRGKWRRWCPIHRKIDEGDTSECATSQVCFDLVTKGSYERHGHFYLTCEDTLLDIVQMDPEESTEIEAEDEMTFFYRVLMEPHTRDDDDSRPATRDKGVAEQACQAVYRSRTFERALRQSPTFTAYRLDHDRGDWRDPVGGQGRIRRDHG